MDKNNNLDELIIRGREKRRSEIYISFMVSNRTNYRRVEFHRVGLEFLKALTFMEVFLEFWEIRR